MTKPASVSGAGLWWVDASGNTLSFPAEAVKLVSYVLSHHAFANGTVRIGACARESLVKKLELLRSKVDHFRNSVAREACRRINSVVNPDTAKRFCKLDVVPMHRNLLELAIDVLNLKGKVRMHFNRNVPSRAINYARDTLNTKKARP